MVWFSNFQNSRTEPFVQSSSSTAVENAAAVSGSLDIQYMCTIVDSILKPAGQIAISVRIWKEPNCGFGVQLVIGSKRSVAPATKGNHASGFRSWKSVCRLTRRDESLRLDVSYELAMRALIDFAAWRFESGNLMGTKVGKFIQQCSITYLHRTQMSSPLIKYAFRGIARSHADAGHVTEYVF